MKHFLQRTLLILLAMTLPVYGWASLAVPAQCSMQTKLVLSQTQHHCCNDRHSNSKTTHATVCKVGQECQSGAWYIDTTTTVSTAPTCQLIEASTHTFFTPQIIDAVWRPPLHS